MKIIYNLKIQFEIRMIDKPSTKTMHGLTEVLHITLLPHYRFSFLALSPANYKVMTFSTR